MTHEESADAGDLSYRERLGDTLKKRDPRVLREFLVQQARTFGDDAQVAAISSQSDDEMTQLMHRMILARPDLKDLHAASRAAIGIDAAVFENKSGSPRKRR
jgi:hypothetical protein